MINHLSRSGILVAATFVLSGCVMTKPVVDYTPEELETLQVTLEGAGAIKPGKYSDNLNDLIWTCSAATPIQVSVNVNNLKADFKVNAWGEYFRGTSNIDRNGEASTSIDLKFYDDVTKHYVIQTDLQLRQQRVKVTIGQGQQMLGGCPTGWFDLAITDGGLEKIAAK